MRVWNISENYPKNAVYIGRGTPYGNPFRIGEDGTRSEVIEKFRCEVLPDLDVSSLAGKNLVCHCYPKACHGDLIFEKANSQSLLDFFE